MKWIDNWHRRSSVCKKLVAYYTDSLEKQYKFAEELQDRVIELTDVVGSKTREIDVLKKIGATGVSGEQHLSVVAECERLKFQNEELTRDFEYMKQRVFDLEQELVRRDCVTENGLPRLAKSVREQLKARDVVVLEDSVPKRKVTKKPVKKTPKAKAKPSPWVKVR